MMTSKERVKTALAHGEPDRVPIDYHANAGIDRRLKAHFGLKPGDDEELRQAFGVDFRGIWGAPYTGPELHEKVPDRNVDLWGIRTRWIEHGNGGGYWDYCDFPLRDADEETAANWPVPSPDDFDYSRIPAFCERFGDSFIHIGSPGVGDVINGTGMLFSMEQVLIDLAIDNPATLLYIQRRADSQLGQMERMLDAGNGAIDMLFLGEDLGTQLGPMISPALFRKHIRPVHQCFVDLAAAYEIPVMIHSCGSSSWAFNDFIEMGISVVDTLQPEAKDMAPGDLKARYGDRLSFHGGISTGGVMANGSVNEVAAHVRETLDAMMPGGGYCLTPSHQLQDNSPTENVLELYSVAHEHGRYR